MTAKQKVLAQLEQGGWYTASMLAHYCKGVSKSMAQRCIRELRKERGDIRKLSVDGSGYYALAFLPSGYSEA